MNAHAGAQTAAPVVVRSRQRPVRLVELEPTAEEENVLHDPDLANMIAECERLNTKKNEYGRAEKKQSDSIAKWLVDRDLDAVVVAVGEDVYDLTYKPGEAVTIDLDLLLKLVGQETFMTIVSATQGAVKKQAGDTIYLKVKQTEETKAKFSMKKRK